MPRGCTIREGDTVVCKKDQSSNTLKHFAQYTFQFDNSKCQACTYFDPCKMIRSTQDLAQSLSAEM